MNHYVFKALFCLITLGNILHSNSIIHEPTRSTVKEAIVIDTNIMQIDSGFHVDGQSYLNDRTEFNEGVYCANGLTVRDELTVQGNAQFSSGLIAQKTLSVEGTITSSNAIGPVSAINFTGSLSGDVTGTQNATVLSQVSSLAGSAGVVHNNNAGVLSSSLVVNADVAPAAAIAYSKLNLTNSVVNADINTAAAIAYSKLNLSNAITNNDISSSAAIAYSKLNLTNSIVNADINTAAAIADTKLATISTSGKVANSATSATSNNTPNTIVSRDGSGNFSAQTITLSGNLDIPESQVSPSVGYILQNGTRIVTQFDGNAFIGQNAGNANSSATEPSGFIGIGNNVMNSIQIINPILFPFDMVGIGNNSLQFAENSSQCGASIAVGDGALNKVATGPGNVAIGSNAGFNITSGRENTLLGAFSGLALTTEDGNILISNLGTGGDTTTIKIGGPLQNRFFVDGVYGRTTGSVTVANLIVDENGQLGTTASSARFKENIINLDQDVVNNVIALRPVEFNYINDTQKTVQWGLIAEETHEIMPELVALLKDHSIYSIRYQLLTPLLLHVWQKQQYRIECIKNELHALTKL